ncbi:MAG: tRNA (adenosine(37)-N6)-threonylcarbamoyltransferase complex dimerization subunit type 1 TsaB [Candidatus Tectimicrobiota bacterium]|nr:MAG: tRNA (adenosine(37)-N6)-threonylcarbamoyltransferase complex dimerization subunit type 1 TsaB [Candidatus Tectomicrobia bacterium]
MRILGIDTAGPLNGVALVEGEAVRAALALGQPPALRRQLLPLIDTLLRQTGVSLADLHALAVNLGPGTFTGIRVGLATAQGLALASGKPLLGCSGLEALAAQVQGWQGLICPVLEARRGEVYAALYRRQGDDLCELLPGTVLTPEALCATLEERVLLVGSGVHAYAEVFIARLGERALLVATPLDPCRAVAIARLAQRRLAASQEAPLPPPKPLYIRAADARLPRRRPVAAGGALGVGQAHQQEDAGPCWTESTKR